MTQLARDADVGARSCPGEAFCRVAERHGLADELNDWVIRRLFGAGLQLENLSRLLTDPVVTARLDEVIDDLDETISQVRRAVYGDSVRELRSLDHD